jgi:hypothetical protein
MRIQEMGIINIEDIKPGMILKKELRDRSGLVLLSAGQEVTEKHLKILKMWGITEAEILGVEREEAASRVTSQIDPLMLQEAEAKFREEFRHADLKNPFMNELFRLLILRKVLQKSGEKGHGS